MGQGALSTTYEQQKFSQPTSLSNAAVIMSNNDKSTKLNRRKVLKVGGSSVAALATSPSVVASSDGEEMVDYVRFLKGNPPNRTKVFGAVPYEHWAVRFTAKDVRDQVIRKIYSEWGEDVLLSTDLGPMGDSHTGFGVRVMYGEYHTTEGTTRTPEPSMEEVRHKLPDAGTGIDEQDGHAFRRDNIPIRVVKTIEYPLNCSGEHNSYCQATDDEYYTNYIPGGIPVENVSKSPTTTSTLAAAFNETDQGHGRGWIGSGHAITEGDDVWYPNDTVGSYIGTCKKNRNDWRNEVEWSYIASDHDDYGFIANDKADGDWEHDVEGIVTDNELCNDAGTSTFYYSRGVTTCQLKRYIKSVGGLGNTFLRYYHDTEAGDSGGPLFKLDANDNAYIAAKHTAEIQLGDDEDSDDCNDDARGTTAETVENKAGGYFRA